MSSLLDDLGLVLNGILGGTLLLFILLGLTLMILVGSGYGSMDVGSVEDVLNDSMVLCLK